MKITNKGRALGQELAKRFDTSQILGELSLIARHTVTLQKYAEIRCDGFYNYVTRENELTTDQIDWLNNRTELLENRIKTLVKTFPDTIDGPIDVTFQNDPRGRITILLIPAHNSAETFTTEFSI